uniref:Uncharacterized protein n=1 Tax=Anguilla anguilla TaxID=7936 RepID=A0A0E9WY91_ANGAN
MCQGCVNLLSRPVSICCTKSAVKLSEILTAPPSWFFKMFFEEMTDGLCVI